VIHPNLINQI